MKINKVRLFSFGLVIAVSCLLLESNKAHAYTISVTTSGAQSIDVMGDRDNATISSDSITVSTTCRSGYNFTVSSSVNDNKLYRDGDSANNDEGTYFSPSDGTAILSEATNTWGYYYDDSTSPSKSSVFSPVPTIGNVAVVKSPLEVPSETDITDNFSIYYGVSASNSLLAGTYKMKKDAGDNDGAIVYQATIADACMRYTVEYNPTDTSSGEAVTGTGSMDGQTIYEGVTTNLSSNTFTAPSGYSFIGWNTAQDGTGTTYTDGQTVTDIAAAGGTITLYAMWSNCAVGNICYRANGNDVVGTMGTQTLDDSGNAIAGNASVTLFASNFSRSGYGFAGWSDVSNYATNPNAKFYGPQETLSMPNELGLRGVNLYAIWVASVGSLQDATKVTELCGTGQGSLTQAPTDGTANLSSVSALTDQRDGQTYAIAKLADGNCWMIENMRIESDATVGNNQTDPSVTNESLSQGYATSGTYGNFVGLADAESTHFYGDADQLAANSIYYSGTQSGTASVNIGTNDNPQFRFPRYNNLNTSSRATNPVSNNDSLYSYGNYYTWPAAIADTSYYTYTSGEGGSPVYPSVTNTSICPSGWHIPTGGSSSDFSNLDISLGGTGSDQSTSGSSARWRRYPGNYVYSGAFGYSVPGSGNIINNRGTYGQYWSSTVGDSQSVKGLIVGNNAVWIEYGVSPKSYGYAFRCLASLGN